MQPFSTCKEKRRRTRCGLVMVEAAVAVIVLSLGLLAAFVLFSNGLQTANNSSEDTTVALFAKSVFARLRAESAMAQGPAWTNLWVAFCDGSTSFLAEVGGPDGVWAMTNITIAANRLLTNIYMEYSLRSGVETNRISHSLRYCISPSFRPEGAPGSNTHSAAVLLEVWSGAYGPTNDNAFLFYTEIPHGGSM